MNSLGQELNGQLLGFLIRRQSLQQRVERSFLIAHGCTWFDLVWLDLIWFDLIWLREICCIKSSTCRVQHIVSLVGQSQRIFLLCRWVKCIDFVNTIAIETPITVQHHHQNDLNPPAMLIVNWVSFWFCFCFCFCFCFWFCFCKGLFGIGFVWLVLV